MEIPIRWVRHTFRWEILLTEGNQCASNFGGIFRKRKKKMIRSFIYLDDPIKKRTSIGHSSRSRPKNKHKRRSWKKYRGQGR